MADKVTVTLVRSMAGTPRKIREHLRGLGLRRMHQRRELEDNPTVRGLIFKVRHLVQADPPQPATQD